MSEELLALRDMARKFSREEILPVAAEHDKTGEVDNLFDFFSLIFVGRGFHAKIWP